MGVEFRIFDFSFGFFFVVLYFFYVDIKNKRLRVEILRKVRDEVREKLKI